MSGFTKEQMAMAKQLQASFGSKVSQPTQSRSGSSHKVGRTSMPAPSVRAPPTSRVPQSQAWLALSTSNGLVRPLPSKAPVSAPVVASRPLVNPAIEPAHVLTVPRTEVKPGPKPAPAQAPIQPAPKTEPKQSPMQLATQPVTQPTSKPTISAPVKPIPQPVTATAPPVQVPPKSAPIDLMSMEPVAAMAIPALVAQPASRCPEVKMGGCDAPSQGQQAASATAELKTTQDKDKVLNVSEDVLKIIKINKMGKSVIWNYVAEAPAVREPSAEELEEMKPLPPLDNTRWVRPWHLNPSPTIGTNVQGAEGCSTQKVPRPVIGLKGSRHAR